MAETVMTPETLALREILVARRDEFQVLLDRYGATNPKLFGSAARCSGAMTSTCFLPSCLGVRSPLRRSPRRCRCESESGEAVNHLPDEIIGTHPEIAWPQTWGSRNILVHQYFDADVVRDVVETHLPPLTKVLRCHICAD